MATRIANVTFDCDNAKSLAQFWAEALGYSLLDGANEQWAMLSGPTDTGPKLLFLKVPESKTAKNRVHLDLANPDLEGEVARLEGLGARRVRFLDEWDVQWWTMLDPEENEFCVAKET